MVAALTATLEPANWPPRVLLQVTGAAGANVTITRFNTDGSSYVVREADADPLVGGALTCYDYDAPHAQAATYYATSDSGDTASTTVVSFRSVGVQRPWLLHPGVPSLSMPLQVAGRGPRTYGVSRGDQDVQGRADSIIVTDGKRKLPSFDLTVLTGSPADDKRMLDILDDASTLLLQLSYTTTSRVFYGWVSVGDVEEADVVEWLGSELLQWTLPCKVTSRPVGKLQAQRTYADVLAEFATYPDLPRTYATYNDLLINSRL